MPQKKGCIPWNKGKTMKTDKRIVSSKIVLEEEQCKKIKELYLEKYLSISQIAQLLELTVKPIHNFLNESGLRRSWSESRNIIIKLNREKIECFRFKNKNLEVVSGFLNVRTSELFYRAQVKYICDRCNKSIVDTFGNVKRKFIQGDLV